MTNPLLDDVECRGRETARPVPVNLRTRSYAHGIKTVVGFLLWESGAGWGLREGGPLEISDIGAPGGIRTRNPWWNPIPDRARLPISPPAHQSGRDWGPDAA